jgi:hypothetical protein
MKNSALYLLIDTSVYVHILIAFYRPHELIVPRSTFVWRHEMRSAFIIFRFVGLARLNQQHGSL